MKSTFAGLGTTTPNAGNWVKPVGNNPNAISEVLEPDFTPPNTDDDAYNLFPVLSVPIGNGFDKLAVASDVNNFGFDGEDLVFEYSGPAFGDALVRGHIEYVDSFGGGEAIFENNLVLRVDPDTGIARLRTTRSRR